MPIPIPMPTPPEPTHWRVERVSGLLTPGFTKELDAAPMHATTGCTSFLGIPIGRFDVVQAGPGVELHYRRWPIVDVVLAEPDSPSGPPPRQLLPATGSFRLPGGRRWRFCSFELVAR